MSKKLLIIGISFYICASAVPVIAARSALGVAVWGFMLDNAEFIAKAIIIAIILSVYAVYLLMVHFFYQNRN